MNIKKFYCIFGRYIIHKNAFDHFVQPVYYYHDVDAVFTPQISVYC